MGRTNCILQANCIGKSIGALLRRSRAFASRYKIHIFSNYEREVIPDDLLAQCALFLYQPLSDKWDALASSRLQEKMPAGCQFASFPAPHYRFFWPNIYNEHNNNYGLSTGPNWPKERHEWGDSWIRDRVADGWQPSRIVDTYMNMDLAIEMDLDAVLSDNIAYEKGKEQATDIGFLEHVLSMYRTEQCFWTPNHPSHAVLVQMTNRILAHLDFPDLDEAVLGTMRNAYAIDSILPMHPSVLQYYGIGNGSTAFRFSHYGQEVSFASWCQDVAEFRQRVLLDNLKAVATLPPALRTVAGHFNDEKKGILTSRTYLQQLAHYVELKNQALDAEGAVAN